MVNVLGVVSVAVFYAAILLVGVWAAWARRKYKSDAKEIMVANRSLNHFVGFITLTATWVGGGYINGSAEAIYTSGLFWCQAPIGFSLSLIIGGYFYAKPMREAAYVTMLDPFQDKYGARWGAFLFLPCLAGELLWSAGILAALGSTLSVILEIRMEICISVSAAIAVCYTLVGGLASVAYTDIVQLVCVLIGLVLAVPYALVNPHVGSLAEVDWLGSTPQNKYEWGLWVDYYILFILGGVPWQAYFQRILAARSPRQAQYLSYGAALGCLVMVIPAMLIGGIAKATDWPSTAYNKTIPDSEYSTVLPLVIQYLTPQWVTFMGLGAVSAAVMSSADSCILSAGSMFSRNIYVNVIRSKASDRELVMVMRISVIAAAIAGSSIAIYNTSVYALFVVCADLVFVMLFPQLTCVLYFPNQININGSISAYFIGAALRILGGEEILGIPTVIKYPWYDEQRKRQLFPFRTFCMVVTFIVLLGVSRLTHRTQNEVYSSSKNTDRIRAVSSKRNGCENSAIDHNNPEFSIEMK